MTTQELADIVAARRESEANRAAALQAVCRAHAVERDEDRRRLSDNLLVKNPTKKGGDEEEDLSLDEDEDGRHPSLAEAVRTIVGGAPNASHPEFIKRVKARAAARAGPVAAAPSTTRGASGSDSDSSGEGNDDVNIADSEDRMALWSNTKKTKTLPTRRVGMGISL